MASLLREVKRLEEIYREEKIPFTLLQILASIGKYIRLTKGKAHPNTVKLINSVYLALEKTAASDGMTQQEKEKVLLVEVTKFKKLKEEITLRKEDKAEEKQDEVVAAKEREPGTLPEVEKPWQASGTFPKAPHEAFATAVEEIKDLIRAEFKALRAEIKLWRSTE